MFLRDFLRNTWKDSKVDDALTEQQTVLEEAADQAMRDKEEVVLPGRQGHQNLTSTSQDVAVLPKRQRTVSIDDLRQLDNFIRDVAVRRDECPRWSLGQKLTKSGAILIGTSFQHKPKYSMRLNVFARDAFRALPGEDDPWNLVAIDREASFTVADVFDHGDVIQYTVVEIDDSQLPDGIQYVLDERSKSLVRSSLIASYAIPTPSYTNNDKFKNIMGNDAYYPRQDILWEVDSSTFEKTQGEATLSLDDPRFEVLHCVKAEDAEYRLIMDHAEARSPHIPAIYKTAYIAKVEGEVLRIVGKGQPTFAYLCDEYIQGDHQYEQGSEPIIKITNKAKYASGNINLPKEGGKLRRIASWVRDTGDRIIVSYLEGYEQDKTVFDSFSELLLYLFANVAYSIASAQRASIRAEIDALNIDEHPPFVSIKLANGLYRMQALDRRENASLSLEFIEAKENAKKLVHSKLRRSTIARAYEGNLYPTMPMVRDAVNDDTWFDPIGNTWFQPILSKDIDKYLTEFVDYFEKEKTKDPEGTIDESSFIEILNRKKSAFKGDIRTALIEIRDRAFELELPYRLCFSFSFDKQYEECRINLFVPDISLFPNTLVRRGDPATYKPAVMDRRTKRGKYADLIGKLSMLLLCLIKSCVPWVTSISLNVWERHKGELQCIATGSFPENRLCSLGPDDSIKALARMRSIGLVFNKKSDNSFSSVKPVFEIDDGNDYRFGFEFFGKDALIPEWLPFLAHEDPFDNLAVLNNELKGWKTTVLALSLDDMVKVADACLEKATEDYGVNHKFFSCSSDIEEKVLREDDRNKDAIYLPRGISQIYSLAGAAKFDSDPMEAVEFLQKARDLNPANTHAIREQVALAIKGGDLDEAKLLLDECSVFVADGPTFAYMLRQYGFLCIERGEYDIARELLIYALAQDDSSQNIEYCINELQVIGAFDLSDDGAIQLDYAKAKAAVSSAGYPEDLDQRVLVAVDLLAHDLMNDVKYCDASLAEAIMAMSEPHEQHREIMTKLFECVLGAKMGILSIFDYLFKPVVLESKELYIRIAERYGYHEEDGCPLCIPYIDPKQGLMMGVVAFVDRMSYGLMYQLDPLYRFKFTQDDAEMNPAYLREYEDYPSLELEKVALALLNENKPSQKKDETRKIKELDSLRDLEMPDNILVVLRKKGVEPEGVWAELVAVEEGLIFAKLVDSPFDDFGIDKCDTFIVSLGYDEELDKTIAYYDA